MEMEVDMENKDEKEVEMNDRESTTGENSQSESERKSEDVKMEELTDDLLDERISIGESDKESFLHEIKMEDLVEDVGIDSIIPSLVPTFEEVPTVSIKTEDEAEETNADGEETKVDHEESGETTESGMNGIKESGSIISDLRIDFNYCAACQLDFTYRDNSDQLPRKLKNFISVNVVSKDVKTVSVLEALLVIFDLRFLKCSNIFQSEEKVLSDISLCSKCGIMVSQMYKLYTEFSELIHAESTLSKMVNHESVLQNNAIATSSKKQSVEVTQKSAAETDKQEFSIRVKKPTDKHSNGNKQSIFESDVESDEEGPPQFINGISISKKNVVNLNVKKDSVERPRQNVSIFQNGMQISSKISASKDPFARRPFFQIKKEHGKIPQAKMHVNSNIHIQTVNNLTKQVQKVLPPMKRSKGFTDSFPSIVSVQSFAKKSSSNSHDEAKPGSSSTSRGIQRPRRTSCKVVNYKQFEGDSESEDVNDEDVVICSEEEGDDDKDDSNVAIGKRQRTKAPPISTNKAIKRPLPPKLSRTEINRMLKREKIFSRPMQIPGLNQLAHIICKLCNRPFKDVATLNFHMQTHKNNGPTFPCIICGLLHYKHSEAVSHLQTHVPEKASVCDYCDATFKTKTELQQHKVHHKELIIFTCQQCQECFPSLMLLNRHEAAIHKKESSFVCPMCPSVSFERATWVKHVLAHGPFKCDKCTLYFHPNDLKAHIQTFHSSPSTSTAARQSKNVFSDLLRAASQRAVNPTSTV